MSEEGYPNVLASAWFAFFVPAKTPLLAIDWLNRHANEIFSAPEVRERFAAQGISLPLGSPAALARHVETETARWGEVIRKAAIKLP